jgi:hypothetical protein
MTITNDPILAAGEPWKAGIAAEAMLNLSQPLEVTGQCERQAGLAALAGRQQGGTQ